MRILQVTDFYWPVIGGLERHVETLALQLAANGHHVAVATLEHPTAPRHETLHGIDVYRMSGWHRVLKPLYQSPERPFHPTVADPGIVHSLRRIIRREQPDIIHAHGWSMHSLLPLLSGHGPRVVVTLHDYGLVCPTKTLFRGTAQCPGPSYRRCLACVRRHYGPLRGPALAAGIALSGHRYGDIDGYISVSSSVERACLTGMRGARSTVIPTLLRDSVFDTVPGERPAFLPRDDGYLLFVGVLAPHKGIGVLLAAYRDLRNPPPLLIIGTPYGISPISYPQGVTLHHRVPHEQVMAAWQHAGVAVVPSCWPEPLPSVLIEAMLSRKAIVASAVGGIPDLVRNDQSALLVPPGDSRALTGALQRLIDDRHLRERLASAARGAAQAYRASRVTTTIERFYQTLLSAPGEAEVGD